MSDRSSLASSARGSIFNRADVSDPMMQTILLVEGDADVRVAAAEYLTSDLRRVLAVASMADLEALAQRRRIDLVVLGATHPTNRDASSILLRDVFGAAILPLFRPSAYARRRVNPKMLGPDLMLGLSDCRIRIDQYFDAPPPPPDVAVRWGGFTLTLEPSAFAFQGKGLDLTQAQRAILTLLMLYGGEVVSRSLIERVVFQGKPKSHTNFISVHVSRLRTKLRDTLSEVFIENVRGEGYALFWDRPFSSTSIPAPEFFLPRPGKGGDWVLSV